MAMHSHRMQENCHQLQRTGWQHVLSVSPPLLPAEAKQKFIAKLRFGGLPKKQSGLGCMWGRARRGHDMLSGALRMQWLLCQHIMFLVEPQIQM